LKSKSAASSAVAVDSNKKESNVEVGDEDVLDFSARLALQQEEIKV
jgi:hypothetical protein